MIFFSLLQSGVSEVIYFVEKRFSNDIVYTASQKLLNMAGVKVTFDYNHHTCSAMNFEFAQ